MSLRSFRLSALALVVLIFAATVGCLHRPSAPIVVTGELRGDLIWSGEVHVGGDVTLAAGARLTIRPGTVVRFLSAEYFPGGATEHPYFPGSELNVAGELSALGTAEAPIVFAAAEEDAPPGSWGAVNLAEGARGEFRHCIFRQADSALHSREATVSVEESVFERNLVGIRFHTSVIRIERNLLRNNGTGLRFHYGAPLVRGNRFEGNRINLFVTAHPRDYLIERNHFGPPLEYQVVLGEEVPEDLQLANNDWGGGGAADVAERLFDGRRVPYLGQVRLEPTRAVSAGEAGPSWIR